MPVLEKACRLGARGSLATDALLQRGQSRLGARCCIWVNQMLRSGLVDGLGDRAECLIRIFS